MRLPNAALLFAFLFSNIPWSATLNIVLSNDDGWAELNIRTLFYKLTAQEHSVIISAPATDQSGKGSMHAPPTAVKHGCQFHSCPKKSPPTGSNTTGQRGRFNYVNSYPVTAMRYGLKHLAPLFFNASNPTSPSAPHAPSTYHTDIALAGPNLGRNTGLTVFISGTVGAATAASLLGYPAIAFSGDTGHARPWNSRIDQDGRKTRYIGLYANWAANITHTLTYAGLSPTESPNTMYLPDGTWLNVNFPATDGDTDGDGDEDQGRMCEKIGHVRFVLSRIHELDSDLVGDGTRGFSTGPDVDICENQGRLPTEEFVLSEPGCWASISVGNATNKLDSSSANQKLVYDRLRTILTCMPREGDQQFGQEDYKYRKVHDEDRESKFDHHRQNAKDGTDRMGWWRPKKEPGERKVKATIMEADEND